jgi:hypothetical protein
VQERCRKNIGRCKRSIMKKWENCREIWQNTQGIETPKTNSFNVYFETFHDLNIYLEIINF